MASTKSKRARRRRSAQGAPRAVPSTRREDRAAQKAGTDRHRRRAARTLGTEGERPLGVFGAVPVSEAAILGGLITAVVGFLRHSHLTIVLGLVICGLGVMEVAGREHLSGFRSHSALLAAIPAVGVEVGAVAVFGDPHNRGILLIIIVPVFAVLFWGLRHRFAIARQARVARAARGTAPSST
jgi:hypothetical protein